MRREAGAIRRIKDAASMPQNIVRGTNAGQEELIKVPMKVNIKHLLTRGSPCQLTMAPATWG